MRSLTWFGLVGLPVVAAVLGGCAHAARDTQGFALVNTAAVDGPFMDTWQATKAVLRERGLDLYTRDKRGVFVAYSAAKRRRLFMPKRTKFTISLGLNFFRSSYDVHWGYLMAASLVAMLPMVIVFFLAQKQFIEGISFSGLKG